MAELTRKEVILVLAGQSRSAGDHVQSARLRLSGVDLGGLDLKGLDLSCVDFTGANLSATDLSDTRLNHSDLSGADMSDAILRGVFAEQACFIDAQMSRTDFRPSERDLFYGTHLRGCDFDGADLIGARLAGADLRGAKFSNANLDRADLAKSRMDERTVLSGSAVDAAQLNEVIWSEAEVPRETAIQPADGLSSRSANRRRDLAVRCEAAAAPCRRHDPVISAFL